MRLLSGLDTADQGTIKISNDYWLDTTSNLFLPIANRKIAYVFQDYGLFPNMTVFQNLQFAKKDSNKELLQDLLQTLELKQLLQEKPTELSGGQQQRVALARAILQEPEFLFLDEPLTALDETLRNKLQNYLITLQQKYKFTVIMISHNLQEVLKIASYACVLHQGKVIQQGAPSLLLSKNKNNTLKAIVLSINTSEVIVAVGVQQLVISANQILSKKYSVGKEIEFKIS